MLSSIILNKSDRHNLLQRQQIISEAEESDGIEMPLKQSQKQTHSHGNSVDVRSFIIVNVFERRFLHRRQ